MIYRFQTSCAWQHFYCLHMIICKYSDPIKASHGQKRPLEVRKRAFASTLSHFKVQTKMLKISLEPFNLSGLSGRAQSFFDSCLSYDRGPSNYTWYYRQNGSITLKTVFFSYCYCPNTRFMFYKGHVIRDTSQISRKFSGWTSRVAMSQLKEPRVMSIFSHEWCIFAILSPWGVGYW